jgi:hypothetical protein
MQSKFPEPGSGGELDSSVNIWEKEIVFTRRAPPSGVEAGYPISVGFKRGASSIRPLVCCWCVGGFSCLI